MKTLIQLEQEAEQIQDFLEITLSDEPEEIKMRGDMLIEYIARTGKMLADAKYILNAKRKDEAYQLMCQIIQAGKVSAKIQNAMADSIAKHEQYLVDWIERLNRTCTHQLDWCRTKLSYSKEEMRLNSMRTI